MTTTARRNTNWRRLDILLTDEQVAALERMAAERGGPSTWKRLAEAIATTAIKERIADHSPKPE